MRFLWPTAPIQRAEFFLLFRARSVGNLASNCPYEIWLDGEFVGDGGHRCVRGKAPLDTWDLDGDVVVRVHFIDPSTTLYCRQAFADPFLAVDDPAAWTCHEDAGVRANDTKVCLQLPRQNVVTSLPAPGAPLALSVVERDDWRLVDFKIAKSEVHEVALRAIDTQTYDLGAIALHRVEVDRPAQLVYSETLERSAHRDDVMLVDHVVGRGPPFGWRGCRYVTLVVDAGARVPALRAWRRLYPLRFKDTPPDPIVDACKRNLEAVVDGGVVDTCWRERAQWTGDLRMSARALRALADNPEVVTLALDQLADSYDEKFAMVPAVAPASLPKPCMIPGYHPAFCLTVAEHGVDKVPHAAEVARASLIEWRKRYVHGGLLDKFPDGVWWFVDWDPTRRFDPRVPDDPSSVAGPDAVTHCWYHDACARFGIDSGIDVHVFDARFFANGAYALFPRGPSSPQANAAAALALTTHRGEAIDFLLECDIGARCTPYFVTFVADAIALRSRARAQQLVRDVVGPRIVEHGTIPEKVNDGYSLAHGWSVGFAEILLGRP